MCMGRTHAVSGAAAWLALSAAVGTAPGPALAGAVICAAGALTPDLDHPNSLIAHRLHIRPLCRVVARLSGGHRHGTHSLLFVVAAYLAALYVHWPLWAAHATGTPVGWSAARLGPYIAAAFATGAAAHLIGDALTPEGVPFGWPLFRHRWSLHLFTTGTRREQVFTVACLALAVVSLRVLGVIPAGPWDHPTRLLAGS